MAYRRRQQQTFNANPNSSSDYGLLHPNSSSSSSSSSSTSIAAKAIRASSAACWDSSLYSAYGFDNRSPSSPSSNAPIPTATTNSSSSFSSRDQKLYEYTSSKPVNESKQGFWGSLARKAKSFIEDDTSPQQFDSPSRTAHRLPRPATKPKFQNLDSSQDNHQKPENRTIHKGLNAISSSLNYIGNAVEEGLTKVENRTADIIQETRKHIRKKPPAAAAAVQNQVNGHGTAWQQPHMQTHMHPQMQTDQDLQLKASRDVAMAMAAKAKLLLRELKTVKADLAFAKERCAQLEEENKILREHHERGDNPEDDDLIRLQLETLLSEKARLAHENSVYARENRFLREVVEYHQLTMQDVVYFDEGTEEVTEVYPVKVVSNPSVPLETSPDIPPYPVPPPGIFEHPQGSLLPSSYIATDSAIGTKKHSNPSI